MDGSRVSDRKRVRFNYDEPSSQEERREKKPRFPKAKKKYPAAQNVDLNWDEEGPVKLTDPRVAATNRAVKRHTEDPGDITLPVEILDAEVEYEDEDGGEDNIDVALEPFNLKQEREEGYFDANGNFVEYIKDKDANDAWLDSAQVDTSLAEKHMKQYAEEEVEHNLSSKELTVIRQRVASVLQTGETVLQALRRLKASSNERDKHSKAKMSSDIKATFDMLTEDAVNLLDHGDFDVYNKRKEDFECDAEVSTSSQGILEVLTTTHPSVNEGNMRNDSSQQSLDMFSDEIIDMAASSTSSNPEHKSLDMFSEENADVSASESSFEVTHGNIFDGDSGYVYDEASGYYYNSTLGYYYDSKSELFCNAASGVWYHFDPESCSYLEVSEEPIES